MMLNLSAMLEINHLRRQQDDENNDVFHVDKNRRGVQLCSGQSVSTFKQLIGSVGYTPVELMEKTINAERYENVTVREIA